MIFAIAEATPFTIVWNVLVVVDRVFELIKLNDVVATTPFVVLVSNIELVDEEFAKVLVVAEAIKLVKLVEVATPLIVEVRVAPEVERELEVIIDEVAVTPFTTEVRMLAAAESVFAFTKLAVVVAITPFTTEVRTKLLVVVETVNV